MAEPKDIVINNWHKGIGISPLLGFADMRNVDIHNPIGVLKIAPAPTKVSSTTVTDLPTWMTVDLGSAVKHYFGGYLDGDNVYEYSSGSVSTLASSNIASGTSGGIIWKGYLVVVDYTGGGSETIDLYKLSNGAWTNGFKTLTGNYSNGRTAPMIWAQDDILYIGNGRYVASLEEVTTFDPSDSGTYTWNAAALDLPEGYHIESFSELGKYLMIGASRYFGSLTQDVYEGRIFPWDRIASSFDQPIILDRGAVRQMISRNGQIVFANGQKGDYQTTNGSFTEDLPAVGSLKQLPTHLTGEIFPEAKAFVNGEYLFGVSTSSTSFVPAGVYGFKNGAWRFLQISTGSTGTANTLRVGVIHNKDDRNFLVGWQDNTTYGLDEFGKDNYLYSGYKASVESPLYQVGSGLTPRTFQRMRLSFAKELSGDHGVRISWRKNLNDSYTTVHTVNLTNYPGMSTSTSIDLPFNLVTDFLQIKCELTTGTNQTSGPELVEIRIS